MFNGKAELVDPEKNVPVATFAEACQGEGTAKNEGGAGDCNQYLWNRAACNL